MIYPIVRIFASPAEAARALAALEELGLSREENLINVVTAASAPTEEGIVAAITAGLVPKAHAQTYAKSIQRGHALISLRPPFGTGRLYSGVLDDLNPVGAGLEEVTPGPAWDDAAPFSSALGFHAISPPSPYRFMGLPAILRSGATTSSALGIGELASPDLSVFGTPALSRNPAPFSGLFRLPLLKS